MVPPGDAGKRSSEVLGKEKDTDKADREFLGLLQ